MSSQFLQENALGNGVRDFIKVQVDNIHSLHNNNCTIIEIIINNIIIIIK